jgi:uncharacterized protein (TIGR03083 family)
VANCGPKSAGAPVAKVTWLGILRDMARARFDFDRQNANGVAAERGATPAETLARLDAVVAATNTPPAPLDSRLVEEVVHGEDIRRPLGLRHGYAPEAVERSLRYQARTSVRSAAAGSGSPACGSSRPTPTWRSARAPRCVVRRCRCCS